MNLASVLCNLYGKERLRLAIGFLSVTERFETATRNAF
jgi:hypothetical protein